MPLTGSVGDRISELMPFDVCWRGGMLTKGGYARVRIKGKVMYAHRYMYEKFVGPIPKGMEIDHLCRNHWCTNPTHLEAVTHQENCKRGRLGRWADNRTHCVNGHPFTAANTYRWHGHRGCRECRREHRRAYERRNRAA